jgi:hypothetical protein
MVNGLTALTPISSGESPAPIGKTSDPSPRVGGELIFELAWRSFSRSFPGVRRPGARVSPRVAGLRWGRGRDGLVRTLRAGRGCARGPR